MSKNGRFLVKRKDKVLSSHKRAKQAFLYIWRNRLEKDPDVYVWHTRAKKVIKE